MTDEKTATFLVTGADDESAVLSDVQDAQVHTLSENPGVEEGDVLDATVASDPPMNVTYSVVEVQQRRRIPVETSDETPTQRSRELAADLEAGELETMERAGVGEVHVLRVSENSVEETVEDVLTDDQTVARAARIGIDHVEIRSGENFVSIRYMP